MGGFVATTIRENTDSWGIRIHCRVKHWLGWEFNRSPQCWALNWFAPCTEMFLAPPELKFNLCFGNCWRGNLFGGHWTRWRLGPLHLWWRACRVCSRLLRFLIVTISCVSEAMWMVGLTRVTFLRNKLWAVEFIYIIYIYREVSEKLNKLKGGIK